MICRNNVAYSSVVFDTSVEIRQVLIKSLDLNIPIDIFVFPTSIANNIIFVTYDWRELYHC